VPPLSTSASSAERLGFVAANSGVHPGLAAPSSPVWQQPSLWMAALSRGALGAQPREILPLGSEPSAWRRWRSHTSWAVANSEFCISPRKRFRRLRVSPPWVSSSEKAPAWHSSTSRATSSELRQTRCSSLQWVTFRAPARARRMF